MFVRDTFAETVFFEAPKAEKHKLNKPLGMRNKHIFYIHHVQCTYLTFTVFIHLLIYQDATRTAIRNIIESKSDLKEYQKIREQLLILITNAETDHDVDLIVACLKK